ncbi:hypothetical protein Taro_004977, partial [Colocasia esculenta]|nr:hypothetical protein [Colocasia esculenta]
MVSTQQHRFKGKINQSTQVDTLSEQVDTRPSSQNSQFEELGQQVDTLPEQVNTGPSSQNNIFHILDSVSTPPLGQVDTLREVFILKWMGATCQPRPMGINLGSCALIPKRFCHGSVDTPIDGVDTGSESLKVFHEDRVKCVDTAPGSVDTSPRFQKTQLPNWDSVSTLVPSPRRPILCNWDSVSTHSVTVSTHSG